MDTFGTFVKKNMRVIIIEKTTLTNVPSIFVSFHNAFCRIPHTNVAVGLANHMILSIKYFSKPPTSMHKFVRIGIF